MKHRCVTCRAVIPAGSSYCRRHMPRHGSTRAWRRTREHILARDRWTCVLCGAPAVDVDHIIPLEDGGSDRPGNLRSLCERCHADSHRSDPPLVA
jgi:5-methylcytosine-specific restriction endonuclease McrA